MHVFFNDDYLLFEAVKSGKQDKVGTLVTSGCQRNLQDERGRTALHWAAERGFLGVMYLLVDESWDLDTRDVKQQTPLLVACNYRREDAASCLITLGCDVNAADVTDNTPLHRAVHMEMDNVALMLCKVGAEINATNAANWTALHEASRIGNEATVRMLLERGADANVVTKNGMSPFLTAIFYYKIAQRNTYVCLNGILKMLIESGCRLSHGDGQWTPLSAAISVDDSFVSALLIYNGCRYDTRSRYSRSLLVDAFTKCEPFVVRLMVLAGYQVSQEEVDVCSRRIPAFSRAFMKLVDPTSNVSLARAELLAWLRQHTGRPKSLLELSRTTIRLTLNLGADDRSILDNIRLLSIPESLKKFLSMSDFISDII